MNDEIVERLVIDRLSGELHPDAAALLEAWLEREPGARMIASEIEQTMRLAGHALRQQTDANVVRLSIWKRWLPPATALAACIAAGIIIAAWHLRQTPAMQPMARSAPQGQSFWSVQRLRRVAQSTVPERVLEWTSPVKKPLWKMRT